MRLIGLCGRSGSGKSAFCAVAVQKGIKVIDCDKVYKDLVSYRSECLLEIASAFGESVIKDDSLDRRCLAPVVFSDPEKLQLLNRITHKHILCEIEEIISRFDESDVVILDAPALFESGLDEKCDLVIGVVAPEESSIARIVARDNISVSEAKSRLNNQHSVEYVAENCDIILYNETTLAEFEKASAELADSLKEGRV